MLINLKDNLDNILNNECANCTKNFEEGSSRKKIERSTTLKFSNYGFITPLEDVSNLQAICYVYGVAPNILENSIKKQLMTTTRQNHKKSRTSENDNDDDPLSSFSLTLCHNCSITLAELYTVFCKYEKLASSKSIIAKGVHYSRENSDLQDIKLECNEEVYDNVTATDFHDFDETSNENFQNTHKKLIEVDLLDSVKVEDEWGSESEYSFNEANTISEGEENPLENLDLKNVDSEDAELNQNDPSLRIETRRSVRRARKQKYETETYSVRENYDNSVTDIPHKYGLEVCNYSTAEEITNSSVNTSAAKRKTGVETRRSTRRITRIVRQNESVAENNDCDNTDKETSNEYSSPEDSDWTSDVETNYKKGTAAKRKIKSPRKNRRNKRQKRYENGRASVTDLEKQTVQRYKEKVPGFHSLYCISCKIYYPNLFLFKRHHQTQHKITWKDDLTLEKWMDLCEDKTYNCDICDEFFISKEELNYHLIAHIRKQETILECNEVIQGPPFVCPKCENSNRWYENWDELQLHGHKVHRVVFTKEIQKSAPQSGRYHKTYYCKECDDSPFTVSNAWATHLNQYHNLSGCCICGNTFSSEQALQSHVKNEHKVKSTKNYSCDNCDEEFPNLRSLWMHTILHFVEGDENVELQTFEQFITKMRGSNAQDTSQLVTGGINCKSATNNVNVFSCLKCRKGFKSFYAMKIHHFAQNINDVDKFKQKDVTGRDFHCPVCLIDCKRSIIRREHCLSMHQTIVSTKTYSSEEFLKKLMKEKEHCVHKCATLLDSKEPSQKTVQCNKCLKNFQSFYFKRMHELVSTTPDVATLQTVTLESDDLFCPKCNLNFDNAVQGFSKLRCHCLEKHSVILAMNKSQLKNFKLRLIHEKEYCIKNQIASEINDDGNGQYTMPINENSGSPSNTEEESEDISQQTKSSSVSSYKKPINPYCACHRCGKISFTLYMNKLHEITHKLDIPSLEKEELKNQLYACPRCGIDFKRKLPRLLKLQIHCLLKHNLIVTKSTAEIESFTQQLINDQEHCNKNKTNDEIIDSTPVIERDILHSTEVKKICSLCDKVCSSYTVKRIHEIVHKIDLSTLEVENIPGSSEFTCPRCGQVMSSNQQMRLHCLESHNVIASTKSRPAEIFIQFLSDEQKYINTWQKENATGVPEGRHTLQDEDGEEPETAGREEADETSLSADAGEGSSKNVTRNVTVDNGRNQYVCDVCGKVVATKHALKGHKVSHQPEKSFICERCGASFKTANLFRFHKRVHFEKDNGIRPTCDICGKSYISSKGLHKHKTNYHPKNGLSCPICNKTFASQEYARKHIKKHQELLHSENKRWRAK